MITSETWSTTPGNAFREPDGAPVNTDKRKAVNVITKHYEIATRNKISCRVLCYLNPKQYEKIGQKCLYSLYQEGTTTTKWDRRCGGRAKYSKLRQRKSEPTHRCKSDVAVQALFSWRNVIYYRKSNLIKGPSTEDVIQTSTWKIITWQWETLINNSVRPHRITVLFFTLEESYVNISNIAALQHSADSTSVHLGTYPRTECRVAIKSITGVVGCLGIFIRGHCNLTLYVKVVVIVVEIYLQTKKCIPQPTR